MKTQSLTDRNIREDPRLMNAFIKARVNMIETTSSTRALQLGWLTGGWLCGLAHILENVQQRFTGSDS